MQINYYIHAYICTYQIQNMGVRIHYILFFFSVLGKGLKNLHGRRLTEQRKGNQQPKNSLQVAWVLDFLLPVILNNSLTLLQC